MNLKQSILATLAYHDIFNYPLTESEIYCYLIGSKLSLVQVKKEIAKLAQEKKIGKSREFYFLNRRKKLPSLRIKRQKISQEKLKRALFYAKILKTIPSIELIAISGALSMSNSTKNDDIDLVIVTSRNALWLTRLFANIILLPYKRSPESKVQKDKACLNIFLDKKVLKITDENLYTAHEICQMKPVWDRNNTYQKFLRSNNWVERYLPNWKPSYKANITESSKHKSGTMLAGLLTLEKPAKVLQLKYMRAKITNEKIGDSQLFFHPKNTQEEILKKYHNLTKRYL